MTTVSRVYLGSDHAGFELKNHLAGYLAGQGFSVVDVGPHEYDLADDYPPFCAEAARRVLADHGSVGLVIGGSGNGEQIAANKVDGIRAALLWNRNVAALARQHNHAQIGAIGARMHTVYEAEEIVDVFLATPTDPDARHLRRIEQLADLEHAGIRA